MEFKDEFIKIIKNTTVYNLSKITGIERTRLQRIKKGERLPSDEELEKICLALNLSDDDKNKLLTVRQIGIIGEDRYNSRRLSMQFISDLSEIYSDSKSGEPKPKLCPEPKLDSMVLVCDSAEDSARSVSSVIYSELRRGSGIKIYSDAADTRLFDIISRATDGARGNIEHLITFIPSSGEYEPYCRNIEAIKKIYSLFLNNKLYFPKYLYSPVNSHALFPYSIITDRYYIILSEGMDNAILICNSEAADCARSFFEQRWSRSRKFIQNAESLADYIRLYRAEELISSSESTVVYSLEPEPALAAFLTEGMISEALNREYRGSDAMLEKIFKALLGQYFKSKKRIVFPESGIDGFLQTGIISELPKGLLLPLKPNDRRRIMNRLITAAKEGKSIFPMLAKGDKLKFGWNIRFYGNDNGKGVFLLLARDKSSMSLMALNEGGLSAPFCDFMQSLEENDCVYSVAETIKILERKTSEFFL